ncbi:hypothetical protein [Yinghuangia seranimata]|uniref:hypothetical protein n=1 Tax=Yinghuangia seranimata TaxID=408067 RepID=UPI00248CE2BE|nr:hypothetical protein [Yinghuangia seranimata]MDI2130519.1 hypothetical protein [Yinghuangia seranimata]
MDLDPDLEALREVFQQGSAFLSADEQYAMAEGLAAMNVTLRALRERHAVYFAAGAHDDGAGGVASATLTVFVQEPFIPGMNPFELARTSLKAIEAPFGPDSGALIHLASGVAAAAYGVVAYAGAPNDTVPQDPEGKAVFAQARIGLPHPDGECLLLLEMATPYLEHADSYGDILLGVADTVRFGSASDAVAEPEPGGVIASITSVLG